MNTTLRAEIKQTRAFMSLEQEVFLQVVRTASALEHGMAEGLKPHGLTMTQYNALRILRGAGAKGLCRNELVDRMLTPVPDATRLLDRLIGAGYVIKHRDAEDKRYVTARITSEGLALLAELDGHVVDMHRKQLGHLTHDELRRLADLLEAVRSTS